MSRKRFLLGLHARPRAALRPEPGHGTKVRAQGPRMHSATAGDRCSLLQPNGPWVTFSRSVVSLQPVAVLLPHGSPRPKLVGTSRILSWLMSDVSGTHVVPLVAITAASQLQGAP